MSTVEIYDYDVFGVYLGSREISRPKGVGLPANCTDVAPPKTAPPTNHAYQWNGSMWQQVEDYRGLEGWLNGAAYVVTAPGPLPEGFSTEPPAPTLQEKQAMIVSAVQAHLDTFAQTRNYDNIFTAATYATSKNQVFAAEGQYAVEARDATWAKCYEILNAVMAGQRPEPTLKEIMDELPVLEWPEI